MSEEILINVTPQETRVAITVKEVLWLAAQVLFSIVPFGLGYISCTTFGKFRSPLIPGAIAKAKSFTSAKRRRNAAPGWAKAATAATVTWIAIESPSLLHVWLSESVKAGAVAFCESKSD